MINPQTFHFLSLLTANNNREWMQQNDAIYRAAKKDIESVTGKLLIALTANHPELSHLQPKDCLFRLHRDVRFSANKQPYKTNFGISIAPGGKKTPSAGYYLHVEPGKSFVGGGIYLPEAPLLQAIRQEIDYNPEEWKEILENISFLQTFGALDRSESITLKRPPKGYDADHPLVNDLKLKSFVAIKSFPDQFFKTPTAFEQIVQTCLTLDPLLSFLNRAITNE